MPAVTKVRRRWGHHYSPYPAPRMSRHRRLFTRYLDILREPIRRGNPTPPATPNFGPLTAGSSSQADETHNGDYEWLRCHFFMPTNRTRLMYWTPGHGSIAMGPAISVVPHTTELLNDYGITLPAGMALVVYNVNFRLVYLEEVEVAPVVDRVAFPSIFAPLTQATVEPVPADVGYESDTLPAAHDTTATATDTDTADDDNTSASAVNKEE